MTFALPALLRATGAELLQWGPGPFTGVSTDSRRIHTGDVFIALSGPNHDGHDFVSPALAAGANAVVVGRDLGPDGSGVAWLRVGDTLRALGDVAAARRGELRGAIIGVTGSNGKTTTREMIAAVLGAAGARVGRSLGNENNLVGLPQTLLRLTGDEDFAVLEMGMNHPGEIWRLAEIARPDVGVITNVGPAHLEGLGSLANVAAAKGELALALPSTSTLVVNGEDPWLGPIADQFPGRSVRTGKDGPVRALATDLYSDGRQRIAIEIDGRRSEAVLRCIGAHNVANALLAAATGWVLGLAPDAIAAGLEAFAPPSMRLEVVQLASGARVLNDAYNANPASMVAALAALAAEPAQRRIAVLGEMWELGPESPRYHRETGRAAGKRRIDRLVAVGRYAEEMVAGAVEAGLEPSRAEACRTPADAARLLAGELFEGDVVLVKGSRAARMEEVVRDLAP